MSTATTTADRWFGNATPGKIGMWVYLVTDAMMFAGFLIAYANLRRATVWSDPAEVLGIEVSGVATFILICSSVSMVMAVQASANADRAGLLRWLGATIAGGVVFLGIQAYEYNHLVHHGLGFANFEHGNNLFGSTFYTITGFHGLHVLTGTVYNLVIFFKAMGGRYDGDSSHVEIAGLFWHFVDLIWILVFTFIYLL